MNFLHIYEHFDMTLNSRFTAVYEGNQVVEKPGYCGTLTDWAPTSSITTRKKEPHRDGRWIGGLPCSVRGVFRATTGGRRDLFGWLESASALRARLSCVDESVRLGAFASKRSRVPPSPRVWRQDDGEAERDYLLAGRVATIKAA